MQLTLPVFFGGLAVSQLFFGSIADHVGRRPPLLCREINTGLLLMGSWRYESWFLSRLGLVSLLMAFYSLAESLPAERPSAIDVDRHHLRLVRDAAISPGATGGCTLSRHEIIIRMRRPQRGSEFIPVFTQGDNHEKD